MEHFNNLEIRCAHLGHEVSFSYCRQESGDLPCLRILSCWRPVLPVESMLKRSMSPETWERFSQRRPKDKLVTILGLIEEAKSRRKRESQ